MTDLRDRNDAVTDGPRPVTVKGQTFLVGRATVNTAIAVRNFLKGKIAERSPVSVAVATYNELPPELRDLARDDVKEAVAKQNKGGRVVDPDAALELLTSPAGCRFLFWVHARKQHPDLKLADLDPLIDDGNAADVFADLDDATGMSKVVTPRGQAEGK